MNKKSALRWILNPLIVLATATCGDTGTAGQNTGMEMCLSGVDSDGDGISDDVECRDGTDPNSADSDGDGIPDGEEIRLGLDPTNADSDKDGVIDFIELNYPKICVAFDRNLQTRPPKECTSQSACNSGEECQGLDPLNSDSDGDGLVDSAEDKNLDGTIAATSGETDPRLWDTDGDRGSDAIAGSKICQAEGLGMVKIATVGSIQVGHDPIFGTTRNVAGTVTGTSARLLEDTSTGAAATDVAALVIAKPTAGADERADATAVEDIIKAAFTGGTVTGILVGRALVTHEQLPAISSTYKVVTSAMTSATALRDTMLNKLIGATAPAGGAVVGANQTSFYVDVTTVRRFTVNDVIITVAPTASYDDYTKLTAIRVNDLINATAVSSSGKTLDYECLGLKADRAAQADFLWTVDVSGSMAKYLQALATTAKEFGNRLRNAGVDYRVGIFDAGNAPPDLTAKNAANGYPNGFFFIDGNSSTAALDICRYVTSLAAGTEGYCPDDPTEKFRPFPSKTTTYTGQTNASQREEPTVQGLLLTELFKANRKKNETNPNYVLRPGALQVNFHVTDEPGSNDFERYFHWTNDPDTMMPWGTVYNTDSLANIVKYFQRNNVLTFGYVPVVTTRNCTTKLNVADLPRCVIEGNKGAAIPISATFVQQDVDAAMNRIVDAVAGAASQYKLTRSPITHTIKVNVGGMDVPRSRNQGFDYDQASRSIIFYGGNYRPQIGQQVFISYRVWVGSIG